MNFRPIVDWLRVDLKKKSGEDQQSTLTMHRPSAPIVDGELLRHRHNILVRHLLRSDSSIQCAQVSLINTHIGEVEVKLCRKLEEKARVWEQEESKGVLEFLGKNLNYMLHIAHVVDHESLTLVWRELGDAPKRQHLVTLLRAFDSTLWGLVIQ